MVLTALPNHNYQLYFAVTNILINLTLCLLLSYQVILVLNFNKEENKTSPLFKINALIPVCFFWIYFCYTNYMAIISNSFHNSKSAPGPVKLTEMGLGAWLFLLMFIYGLINYLFINNKYVLRRIRQHEDIGEQEYLKTTYWLPMRKLVRASVYVFCAWLLLSLVTDVITLRAK